MKLNRAKLNRAEVLRHIRFLEAQIKDNKDVLGYDHRGREFSVAARMADLEACRRKVTVYYTIIAHVRGHIHQQGMNLGQQEKWLLDRKQLWQEFLKKEEKPALTIAA